MIRDPEDIEVKRETVEGVRFVQPQGDIDLARAPSLRHHLAEAQHDRPQRLVIDLGKVPYMDSSGVATLVEAMQIARRQQTRLVLCCLQDKVRSIFEIARLGEVFVIAPGRAEALNA